MYRIIICNLIRMKYYVLGDYAEIVGQPINFRDFGFSNLEGLLRSLHDTIHIEM